MKRDDVIHNIVTYIEQEIGGLDKCFLIEENASCLLIHNTDGAVFGIEVIELRGEQESEPEEEDEDEKITRSD